MSRGHRLFAPRPARKKLAAEAAAKRRTEPIATTLAEDLGQDPDAAARNAQSIAAVLKRALRRRKAGGTGPGTPPA